MSHQCGATKLGSLNVVRAPTLYCLLVSVIRRQFVCFSVGSSVHYILIGAGGPLKLQHETG